MHYCYLIYSQKCNTTYIGITDDYNKRLSQHNGILAGGAKATKKADDWEFKKIISVEDKSTAASLEWYWKHYQNKNGKWCHLSGLDMREKRLEQLKERFNYQIVELKKETNI